MALKRFELRTAAHENWRNNPDASPEALADIGYATPQNVDEVIDTTIRRQKEGYEFSATHDIGSVVVDHEAEIDETRVQAEEKARRLGGRWQDHDWRYQ